MKHMVRAAAALLALILSLILAACGGKAAAGTLQPAPPEPPKLPETPDAVSAGPSQFEPERAEVENNGGFFVRVGGDVWFRHYGGKTFDEPQLWGDFLSAWPSHGSASTLCRRSEADGTVTEALPDDGFGPLWFGTDGFYLTRVTDTGAREAYFKALDGAETPLRKGVVAGVSDSGRYAAVQSDGGGEHHTALYLYDGTRELRSVLPGEHTYRECAALTDAGSLLYLCHDLTEKKLVSTLLQLDADGVETVLGTIFEPDSELFLNLELEQCVLCGDEVCCVLAWYNGTGHFLSEALCVRATLSMPDSLRMMEMPVWTDFPDVLPKLCPSETGGVTIVKNLPDSLAVAENSLFRFDASGESELIAADLLKQSTSPDEECLTQTVEAAGGGAYLMVMSARRSPDDDVGWRMAYAPGELRYLRVPFDVEPQAETLFGDE